MFLGFPLLFTYLDRQFFFQFSFFCSAVLSALPLLSAAFNISITLQFHFCVLNFQLFCFYFISFINFPFLSCTFFLFVAIVFTEDNSFKTDEISLRFPPHESCSLQMSRLFKKLVLHGVAAIQTLTVQ